MCRIDAGPDWKAPRHRRGRPALPDRRRGPALRIRPGVLQHPCGCIVGRRTADFCGVGAHVLTRVTCSGLTQAIERADGVAVGALWHDRQLGLRFTGSWPRRLQVIRPQLGLPASPNLNQSGSDVSQRRPATGCAALRWQVPLYDVASSLGQVPTL